jgi:hypothetical protein
MVDIFVWEMFKTGVGHASMFVHGNDGKAYISWWPAPGSGVKRAIHGMYSHGLVHSIHTDKEEDGVPDWCSKPLQDLDEKAIIEWWKQIAPSPNLHTGTESAKVGNYVFLTNNCAGTVVRALLMGASPEKRKKIKAYFHKQKFGSLQNAERFRDRLVAKVVGGVGSRSAVTRSLLETDISIVSRGRVIAPFDCRNIVEEVWG